MAGIKFDGMLAATFFANVFYSATYPCLHKVVIQSASDSVIAALQIVTCVSVIVFGRLWNRKSDALFRFYPAYCIAETACGIASTAFAIITGNIIAYYILDTVIFALVTRNIICGGVKLKALRYSTEKAREQFDNNSNSMAAIATIIGSAIAMTLDLSFPVMLCVATFGNAIDNAFYARIYLSVKKKADSVR